MLTGRALFSDCRHVGLCNLCSLYILTYKRVRGICR